jgi:hypothetical protein
VLLSFAQFEREVTSERIRDKIAASKRTRLTSFDQKRTNLTPGTVLIREWDRQSQRVMVMANGFAWNGQTYDSLSKVAFAITGTKWNGPRFFGLRDKEDRSAMETRP